MLLLSEATLYSQATCSKCCCFRFSLPHPSYPFLKLLLTSWSWQDNDIIGTASKNYLKVNFNLTLLLINYTCTHKVLRWIFNWISFYSSIKEIYTIHWRYLGEINTNVWDNNADFKQKTKKPVKNMPEDRGTYGCWVEAIHEMYVIEELTWTKSIGCIKYTLTSHFIMYTCSATC